MRSRSCNAPRRTTACRRLPSEGRLGTGGPRDARRPRSGYPSDTAHHGRPHHRVDPDRQLVLVVDDRVVTRTFDASSGNGETDQGLGRTQRAYAPTGDLTVIRQIDAMHESTLGLGSMYRSKYFYRGWAVRGSGHIPPWPASHGRVRVSNAAISWVCDVWGAPTGTGVLVY